MLRVLDFAAARHRELALLLGKRKARGAARRQQQQRRLDTDGATRSTSATASSPGGGVRIERRLRRRTTSHKRRKGFVFTAAGRQLLEQQRRRKRRRVGEGEQDGKGTEQGSRSRKPVVPLAQLPRSLRRRIELRRGTAGCDVDPGPGRARRLETHAWHAKRMRMSQEKEDEGEGTWGFRLALSATRDPSKAVVRAARERAVMHDASYTRVLALRGRAAAVQALLAACLDPAEAAVVGLAAAGGRVAEAVFYRPGAFPEGALGPVRWLWRPPPLTAGGDAAPSSSLWLWLHPAFADEATAALKEASSAASSVELQPVPDLLLFEIRGPGAHPLLQRVLRPVRSAAEGEGEGNALWAGLLRHVSSARAETFPRHGTALALRVMDPRETRPCRGPEGLLKEEEGHQGHRRRQKANKTRRAKLAALLHGEEEGPGPAAALAGSSLWSAAARVAAAADARTRSDVVNAARRRRRRQAGTWQGLLAEEKEEKEEEGSSVPVVLVARGGRGSRGLFLDGGDLAGYDLILPRGWGRPFWHALLLHTDAASSSSSSSSQRGRASGPRALGLEDRERLALEFGLPSFPRDWPDTPAGRQYWAASRASEERRQRRRPARKRLDARGLPRAWGEGEVGVGVLRRAAALEAAVAVADVEGEGYLGRIFPESGGEAAEAAGRDDDGRRQAASGATALLPVPRYRRLRPTATAPAPGIPSHHHHAAAAAVLLHCPWGGLPSPCATILAPASTDYRAWRGEQAAAAARRKCRTAALQAGAQGRAAASLPSLSSGARAEAESQATRPGWAPSARPAALPQGATPRIALGAVTSAGFALGAGHAVAHGLVSIDGLRRMQVGAAKGVPAPMACLVLVKDPRSGVAYPARLRLWCC